MASGVFAGSGMWRQLAGIADHDGITRTDPEPARHQLIGRQADADGELCARAGADRLQKLAGEAQPGVGVTVVIVTAPVAEPREKLRRQISVRH